MINQKGIVIDTPAYQELSDAIEEMADKGLTGHRVVWETTEKSHDSTEYVVKDYGEHLGDPTLIIWGRGGNKSTGGKYEIIPKPDNPAWIRYHYPNDDRVTDEQLTKLAILSPDFSYAEKQGWHAFLENPFDVLERIR